MTHNEIVEDIQRFGWNVIRWGHQPFSAMVIEALIEGRRLKDCSPEYFLVGQTAAGEIKQLDEDRAAVHFPSEKTNGEAICTIAGFPVFVCESMPNDILALIFPSDKLFPGDKMEMTMHVASYVETAGASQP